MYKGAKMNAFDRKLSAADSYPLRAEEISTLQVNMGYRCNLRCTHCHVEASPDRREEMSSATADRVIDIIRTHVEIKTVDITGGSPELNPNYKRLVKAASDMRRKVIVRSNLAIIKEPGMEDIPAFWVENRVKVVASMPCYTANGVDGQRGKGTYHKIISVLKQLNSLGYGKDGSGLEIDLMFNPAKSGVTPEQKMLENAYKEKLIELHGITFNHLIALSNMPIGRLAKSMSETEKKEYMLQLEEKYNPETVGNLMCRHLISVAPDGSLHDCDFWQVLKLCVKDRDANDVETFNYESLSKREILTARLCFLCTAGAGASCSGALT